jgi:hypothetical protein
MKTLQDQYTLIKEGKGHKDVFLKESRSMFPNYIRNAATFDEAAMILKDKGIISENIVGMEPINTITTKKAEFESAFENFLEEARKNKDVDPNAELKKTSQQVEDKLKNNYDYKDTSNPNNQIFGEIMKGYYCEMKDPKNADKTEEELREIVLKNLAKDPIYYTKNGMFGEKDLGLEMDVPGLGEPVEPKGEFKASGYGDLKESKLRTAISSIIKQELIAENKKYQKTIKEIEKEAKLAEITTKMEALDKAIESKTTRLSSIDESEDLKELVDKNAIKELKKEVKLLEKYKAKVQKMYEKLCKTDKSKEIIDEDNIVEADQEDIKAQQDLNKELDLTLQKADSLGDSLSEEEEEPSESYLEAKKEAEERVDNGEEIEVVVKDFPDHEEMLFQDLKGKYEG